MKEKYENKSVVVTGGASFIGSHLVDELVRFGARVRVVDNLSSGVEINLENSINDIDFVEYDLRNRDKENKLFNNADIVFHLAAIHGGRGFIETQQRAMLDNFNIDTNVFTSCVDNNVKMIVHASSACVYPITLQSSENERILLNETSADFNIQGNAFPDGVYGWTKLMGEYQLETLSTANTRGRSARIFTAYGERENLSHAAIALIAKADLRLDPFPVWGSGNQTRNFTHVSDTVKGLLFLATDQTENKFNAFNIGTSKHIPVKEFIDEIFKTIGWEPRSWNFELEKPIGVKSRASDNEKIVQFFGWEPNVEISEGIRKTIEWYYESDVRVQNIQDLDSALFSR